MPERADTLEVIGLIMFAPLPYSMVKNCLAEKARGHSKCLGYSSIQNYRDDASLLELLFRISHAAVPSLLETPGRYPLASRSGGNCPFALVRRPNDSRRDP